MPDSFDPYRKWLGIPCEEQPPHHYRLLGIPLFEADLDVIENAAHRQMVYVRTFQTGKHADLSQKLLNELAAAKVCLMSRAKKAAYDQELHAKLSATGPETKLLATQATQGSVATVSAVATASESNVRPPASPTGDEVAPTGPGAANHAATAANHAATAAPLPTATHDHARTRRPLRQRMFFVPLIFGSLGVAAVVVIVALLALNFKLERNQAGGVADAGLAAGGPASWLRGKGAGGKTSDGEGTPTDGAGASPATASPPVGDARIRSPREERIRQQLPTVRAALAARDLSKAKTLLQGLGTPTRDLALAAEKERLELVHRFLADFWSAVQRGVGRAKSRVERRESDRANGPVAFEYFGVVIELTDQDDGKFKLAVDGKPWEGPLTNLPPKAAAALAVLGLEDADGFGRFYLAAFLLIDGQGDPAENRKIGEAYYRLAERMVGQPNYYLADEFKLGVSAGDADESPIPPERLRVRPKPR